MVPPCAHSDTTRQASALSDVVPADAILIRRDHGWALRTKSVAHRRTLLPRPNGHGAPGVPGPTGPTGPAGDVGPTGPAGQDADPATLDALNQLVECNSLATVLTNAGAYKVKWRDGVAVVELDVRLTTHIGIDLVSAIACTELVFDMEVILKDGGGGKKKKKASVASQKFVRRIVSPSRESHLRSRSRQTACTPRCNAANNPRSRLPARARSRRCRAECAAS